MSILTGKKILVTRALDQNAKLINMLESRGAIALPYPCIEIKFLPFEIPKNEYDSVIFTSKNSVKALNGHRWSAKNIAKIDPKTAPDSKSLSKLFEDLAPQKILLPQGDLADSSLADALTAQGHEVTRLTVYSTRKPTHHVDFNFEKLDAITFTSPSAIKNFLELTELTTPAAIACIGTTTYQAAKDSSFTNIIHAKEHSLDGLVKALEDYFDD